MGSWTLWQRYRNILDKYFKPSLNPFDVKFHSNWHVLPRIGSLSFSLITLLRYSERIFFKKTKFCIHYLFLNTEKPTAKVSPKPYPTLTQGDKLRLTCSVNEATVNITWKKDGDPIKERAVIDTQLDETTSYLVIAKVVEEDSGEHSCEARNRLGNVARSIVMIKVNRKLALL